jgi:hypothetical protein
MNIQDATLKMKIQNRVSSLVKTNMDDDGNIKFDQIKDAIIAEFGEEALVEAKKQFDFMIAW